VEQAWNAFGDVLMFLPVSAGELKTSELFDSLDRLKQRPTGEARLVLQMPPEAMRNAADFTEACQQLKEIGLAVALDRFAGTATELGTLRGSPPAYVKLPSSVVQSLSGSPEQRRKLQALLQTAHDMGSQVVACGVSTEDQWLACKSVGVPLAQGDFAAAAMPLDACCAGKR
jgi:EAL domain-containing protein (putative c-di-GMP-specific phosphodiesterase class I)